MQHFSGKILDGNQILLANVEGVLFVNEPPTGRKSWYGTFDLPLPAGKNVKVGALYCLELDDGRSGKIRIKRVPSNNTGTKAVEFRGHGPLQ